MNTIELTKELSQNFLDFSHEANYQRAFADARDGLKPGQRACLWEMYKKGYKSSKPHVKSAKISGGVVASWWPHGDTAVYETFARMSQKWINNIPEVDWHGANGSVQISGEPAANRYTEARLTKLVEEGMLGNIDKNNVPMKPNFSDDDEWPVVFPAIFPRLMVNGCQGIGSTIANVWLPHSFIEVSKVIEHYIDTGEVDYDNIAPSFPSGGIIINKNDVSNIYKTGKGKVILRGRAEIKKNLIIITEIPYQVYVEPLIDEIKNYAVEEENSGIENVINKSGKTIHIEIECSADPSYVLKQLYAKTSLQKNYNANQYALTDKGVPALLTLADYLRIYTEHNLACIVRETQFDLEKAEVRKEIVEGLLRALLSIDEIIAFIKNSESSAVAKEGLIKKYNFTENQAKAILAMRLSTLAKLEGIELNKEKAELEKIIERCKNIINSKEEQTTILKERLSTLVKKYGDARRTELAQIEIPKEEKAVEAIISEDVVVIFSQSGDIKRVPRKSFKVQRKNGKGVKSIDEAILTTISTNTVDTLMLFTSKGRMFRLFVDDVPVGTNVSKGVKVNTLIDLDNDEKVIALTSLYKDSNAEYVVFFTKNGLIKKTKLEEYTKLKKSTGLIAINLKEGDSLANVTFLNDEDVIVVTKQGMSIYFPTSNISPIGRVTAGVRSIKLEPEDEVIIGLPVHKNSDTLALFTTNGYAKKISLEDCSFQLRGGKGVCAYKVNPTIGNVVGAAMIDNNDDILLVGLPNSICISATDIPIMSRVSSGSIMIKNSKVVSVVKL